MKIKRSETLRLEGAFSLLLEVSIEPGAAFKVASNLILASELAEKIRKAYKPVDGHKEFSDKRNEILSGFNRMADGGVSVPAAKAEGVSIKLKALSDEYKDVIANQVEYDEKFNKILDAEAEMNFEKITMDELLVDSIEPAKLLPLIKNGIISNGNKS